MDKKIDDDLKEIRANMVKNDKFIGDVLAPFEQALGMKFNKFEKPEDPHFVEPKKKKGLKGKLKVAERKQQKLKKMDPEEAKQVHWKNAIDKAQGIKVKDDPKLIRKAMKRKEAEKKRHKKKWAERTEKLEESKKLRQKKRKERIKKAKAKKNKSRS